jgi:hypothetical protein
MVKKIVSPPKVGEVRNQQKQLKAILQDNSVQVPKPMPRSTLIDPVYLEELRNTTMASQYSNLNKVKQDFHKNQLGVPSQDKKGNSNAGTSVGKILSTKLMSQTINHSGGEQSHF